MIRKSASISFCHPAQRHHEPRGTRRLESGGSLVVLDGFVGGSSDWAIEGFGELDCGMVQGLHCEEIQNGCNPNVGPWEYSAQFATPCGVEHGGDQENPAEPQQVWPVLHTVYNEQ